MKKTSTIKTNATKTRLYGVIFYIGLIAVWQLIFYAGAYLFDWWKPYSFPNPEGVAESLVKLMTGGKIIRAILFSMKRCIIGFLISVIVGTLFGLLISLYSMLNSWFKPLISGIQSLPSVCWVPFAILWFGLNESAIIFVVVMGSICSVTMAIDGSIKAVPPMYIKVARTLGADKRSMYRHVLLPAILPSVVSGLRQAWSFAWRALMSAEVMSATVGLGYSLAAGRDMADINQVGLVMIVIIIVGILIDKCVFSIIETRLLKKRGMIA